MQLTKISLNTLFIILSFSVVNAQVDDNPTGDDIGAPGQLPGDANVVSRPGDDNVFSRPYDDHGTFTSTTSTTSTTSRPTGTSSPVVPTNAAMKNGMGTLGITSMFVYFIM